MGICLFDRFHSHQLPCANPSCVEESPQFESVEGLRNPDSHNESITSSIGNELQETINEIDEAVDELISVHNLSIETPPPQSEPGRLDVSLASEHSNSVCFVDSCARTLRQLKVRLMRLHQNLAGDESANCSAPPRHLAQSPQ